MMTDRNWLLINAPCLIQRFQNFFFKLTNNFLHRISFLKNRTMLRWNELNKKLEE